MDLGDVDLNHAVLSKVDTLATYVLVVNPLSYTFATFATSGISRAVGILEGTCELKVIAATADGASSNRYFLRCTKDIQMTTGR